LTVSVNGVSFLAVSEGDDGVGENGLAVTHWYVPDSEVAILIFRAFCHMISLRVPIKSSPAPESKPCGGLVGVSALDSHERLKRLRRVRKRATKKKRR
jgi:hypothetical protein